MKNSITCIWPTPGNAFPEMIAHQLHIWCALINNYHETQLADFFNILTAQEQMRAKRFYFEKDRARFIATRAILKKILGRYLKILPQALRFSENSHGKPALRDYPHLQFNVSHSQAIALYAFALDQPVGVDVEYIDNKQDIDAIVQRFFATREYQILKNLNEQEKKQAFFKAWARKEAVLKALGVGLAYSLADIEMTTLPTEPAPLVKFAANKIQNDVNWYLSDLSIPVDNYAAAVAAQGHINTIKNWCWQD